MASDAAGDTVVVWTADPGVAQNGGTGAIYAQRYNASGVAQGGVFRADANGIGATTQPAVAMDAAGNFVVAYSGHVGGDEYPGDAARRVFVRAFHADGTPAGDQVAVDDSVASTIEQFTPSVAVTEAGAVVVAWASDSLRVYPNTPDPTLHDVFVRGLSSNLVPRFSTVQLNTTEPGPQADPSVAVDASGNFVAAWDGPDADGSGVYFRRFTAGGGALDASDRQVNTTVTGNQSYPKVAEAASTGKFAVVWQDEGTSSVSLQRYSSGGVFDGGEQTVNSTAGSSSGTRPVAAMDSAGDLVVLWVGTSGIRGQYYTADGLPDGGELAASTSAGSLPAVAISDSGDFLGVWLGSDSGNAAVVGQRFHHS